MNFSPTQNQNNNKKSSLFIAALLIMAILSFGYIGKNLFASIWDNNDYKTGKSNSDIILITSDELKETLETNPELILIDVRARKDYEWEHLESSMNIPLNELSLYYDTLDKKSEIITFCDSSKCEYSKIAARRLMSNNFSDVKVLNEGIEGLKLSNLEIIKSGNNQIVDGLFKVNSKTEVEYKKSSKDFFVVDYRKKNENTFDYLSIDLLVGDDNSLKLAEKLPKEQPILIICDNFEDSIKNGSDLYDSGFFGVYYLDYF